MATDKKESFKEIINGDQPVLVDFFATWCGPCMAMNPVLKQLAGKIKDQGKIIKVDVDKNAKFAADIGVMGVPTFMIFKNGKKLWHEAGTKTLVQLVEKIEEFQ